MIRALRALVLFVFLTVASVAAQTPSRLAISGRIVDAETGIPLAFAAVTLEPVPGGVMPGGTGALQQSRATTSNPIGEYHFENVSEGDYRLHVQLIGYRSRSVDVQVRPQSSARVSVGLEIKPVELEAVDVAADPRAGVGDSYARRARELDDITLANARRLAAERMRQRLYLSSDVRALTHADIAEGVSLGETDLFRSLHRLAGVSTSDDWSAELITRGAPWDHTRVYFDGMPLFNALHALGVFSGVNSDAIGAAFLHPGVQPVALGGAAAGALDIRSRSGSGEGELNGVGELSLVSARIALDQRSRNADHAWMISARRTYLDVATRVLAPVVGEEASVPYAFFDVTARADLQLAGNRGLEISGLWSRDNAHGDIHDVLENQRAKWGDRVLRATYTSPIRNLNARHTLGYSHYGSRIRVVPSEDPFELVTERAGDNQLGYVVLRGDLLPLVPGRWSGGYEAARYNVAFSGDDPVVRPSEEGPDSLDYSADLNVVAGWIQHRTTIRDFVSADVGLRLETGSTVSNRSNLALSPRASLRFQLGAQTTASVAAGRSWQYTQALAPSGIGPVEGFASDFIWLLAADTMSALRADVATVGAERWVGDRLIVSANAYVRRVTGMAIPDPAPGSLFNRMLFVSSQNNARGIELSVRKLTGNWTGSGSYTYGHSTLRAAGLQFAAPTDQRHVVDLTAAVRLTRSFTVGAAYTGASGAPYTRHWSSELACGEFGCTYLENPRQAEPSALRRRAYHSLDMNLEWARRYRRWQMSAFLQARNLLNHANQGRYLGATTYCTSGCGTSPNAVIIDRDEFVPGIPTIPLIGFRVGF